MTPRVRTILIGMSVNRAGTLLVVALGLMLGLYLLLNSPGAIGDAVNTWLGHRYNFVFFMLILLIVSAISSYLNNGVITSVSLASAPLIAYFLSGNIAFALIQEPTLVLYAWYVLQGIFMYGIPIGVSGHLLGRGIRDIQRTLCSSSDAASQ